MAAYSGKLQYFDERGVALIEGACQVSFDKDSCVITPATAAPLAFDFGDVDAAELGEWDLSLALYTGRRIELRQFGTLFSRMANEIVAAWRDRSVKCLLLEDLEGVMRCPGVVEQAPAEVRLYRSNLAVLPMNGAPFQWRLAEVEPVVFDETTYSITLRRGGERLTLGKLGRKTDEFLAKLRGAVDALRTQSARALHERFPFLTPDALQQLVTLIPEGRSVRLAALAAIHPRIPDALVAQAVDERLKPYFDALRARSVADSLMAGFKFVRKDEVEEADTEEADAAAEPEPEAAKEEEGDSLFFWFFFPMAGRANVVAWEATMGSGRATYFFRIEPPGDVEAAVTRITRGLALVNFRREPVYLSDASLEQQPRFRRYAIGSRKLPDLRYLRSAMMGRALHTTLEQWQAQAQGITGSS